MKKNISTPQMHCYTTYWEFITISVKLQNTDLQNSLAKHLRCSESLHNCCTENTGLFTLSKNVPEKILNITHFR